MDDAQLWLIAGGALLLVFLGCQSWFQPRAALALARWPYVMGTGFETREEWWNVIMAKPQINPVPGGGIVTGGDCDDWAQAHEQALALLGVSGDVRFVKGQVHPTISNQNRGFLMKPNGSGGPIGWNFHAVSRVAEGNNYCYSITQPNKPTGSLAQMQDGTGNGLVIQAYTSLWHDNTNVPDVRDQ